jgi:predicted aspartyl protease
MSAQVIRAAGMLAAIFSLGSAPIRLPYAAAPVGSESVFSSPSCEVGCQDESPLTLRIKIIGSNPVTEITIGGKSIQAIVDTGGGAIALSEEVIRSSGATRLKNDREWVDALGKAYRVPQFKVPKIDIGSRTFQDVLVIVAAERKGPPVPNTIGGQFLSHYIAVVDYAGLSITLWPNSAKLRAESYCDGDSIPMENAEQPDLAIGLFATPSGPLRLLLDTGATYSMLPNTLIASRRLATTRQGDTPFYGPVELTVGKRVFAPLEFVVLPLQLPRDFDGMLGANFFKNHVVCLNFQRREVRVR